MTFGEAARLVGADPLGEHGWRAVEDRPGHARVVGLDPSDDPLGLGVVVPDQHRAEAHAQLDLGGVATDRLAVAAQDVDLVAGGLGIHVGDVPHVGVASHVRRVFCSPPPPMTIGRWAWTGGGSFRTPWPGRKARERSPRPSGASHA